MSWYNDYYFSSGLENWASSMATTEEADTYLDARGKTDWSLSTDDDAKGYALQRAWDYLCGLDCITGVFTLELPDKVKYGQIVAAYEEFKNPNCLQPALTADDFVESKNIAGVIQKTYRQDAPITKRFIEIESLLKPYLKNKNSSCIYFNEQ
jgi:hypothetical protein